MKRLFLVFVLSACATCAGIHRVAAADAPVAAGNLPPRPTLSRPADARHTPWLAPLLLDVVRDSWGAAKPLHDPTQPSPLMRQLINPAKLSGQAKAPEIPTVELKSRIIGGTQPGVAVLGIDKQTYIVSKGSEFSLAGPRYGGQKIRVVELDTDVVRLEILPMNLSVTLR